MIDRKTYQLVQDVIRRQGRSFLQYADESSPWSNPENGAGLGELKDMVREERAAAAALSRFLLKIRLAPPYLGAYPSYFTSYNYLSLNRLLQLLVEHEQRTLAELQADLLTVPPGEVRQHVQDIIDMKQRHLKTMETLAAGQAGR